MKYAADFRASAREALRGRWGIAVLAGLLASILGGVISRGPELTFSYDDYGLNANLRLLGQTVYSWGGNSSPVFGALLAGGVFYLLLVGLVLAALFFTLGSVVGVGYARFNLNLLDGERPAVETLFAYFPYWKTTALNRLLQTLYVLLWSLLLIVPGIMAAYSYAMTEFLLADNPDLTPSEALAQSKAMMYGIPLAALLPADQLHRLEHPGQHHGDRRHLPDALCGDGFRRLLPGAHRPRLRRALSPDGRARYLRSFHPTAPPDQSTSDDGGVGKAFEMVPFLQFCRPGISRYTERGDNQDLGDFKAVKAQVEKCRQCDDAFSKPHVQEYSRFGMPDNEIGGIGLIVMRTVFHRVSLRSVKCHPGHRF